MQFTKMHGLGNDYIFINDDQELVMEPELLAPLLSDRHRGVGGDGLILIDQPTGTDADVRMRMFNADGSEAEMCGNGIRCVCKYAYERDLSRRNPMQIATRNGVLAVHYEVAGDDRVQRVTVNMGEPAVHVDRLAVDTAAVVATDNEHHWQLAPTDEVDECVMPVVLVGLGNPHAIAFLPDEQTLQDFDLKTVGPVVENHPAFPQRVNFHVVSVASRDRVAMRTWERGSGITQACGTGASAVCVAGALTGRTNREIAAALPGGTLQLRWDSKTNHVFMTGPAVEVFTGEISDALLRPDRAVSIESKPLGQPVHRTSASHSGGPAR